MKKIKLFVLALVFITGCSNFQITNGEDESIKDENYIEESVEQQEIVPPSQIIRDLEEEIKKTEESESEKVESQESVSAEKIQKMPESEIVEEVINKSKVPIETLPEKPQENLDKRVEKTEIIALKKKGKESIERFVNLDMLKYSNIGISIIDLQSGEQIGSYNKNKAITPASILKVVTSSAALEVLGADTRLETKLLYDGKIDGEGTLAGDIYIIGGGDPTLGSDGIKRAQTAFMQEWIEKIKVSGIKNIKGDIIVVDNLFGYVGVEEKWLWEDFGTAYGQGTYGISIFDNLYTLYLESDDKSVKVVKTKPQISDLKFENRLKISPRGRRDFTVRGLPFENKRVLNGEVPANSTIVTKSDIPNPGLFLGEYLKSSLKNSNINVSGKVKTSRVTSKRGKNLKTIAVTKSVTIEEMIKVLLKRSDNHYTEHLYQLLKLEDIDIEEFWKEKGIDTEALVMCDGSGLSRGNYVSAEILTEILAYMYKNYPSYEKLLPRGGYDGTVADFLGPKIFSGEVRVKSGSMSGIQAYTGYIKKGDKRYAFTIIVNHWNGSRRRLKNEMEKLIIDLF